MADETTLIRIDASLAVDEIIKYVDAIDKLKAKQGELATEINDLMSAEGDHQAEITAKRKELESYKASINALRSQLSSLRKATTEQAKADRSHKDYIEMGQSAMKRQIQSIQQAVEANRILREAVRNITDAEDYDLRIREAMNRQIEENTEYIRRNSDAYVQQKMNIGNYAESIKNAFGDLMKGGSLEKMFSQGAEAMFASFKKNSQDFAKAMRDALLMVRADTAAAGQAGAGAMGLFAGSVTAARGAVGLLGAAMKSLGSIGLFAVFQAISSAIQRTNEGMEEAQLVMAGLSQAFDVVMDRLAILGNAFSDLIHLDFKGFAQGLKDTFTGIGKELKDEVTQAMALKAQLQNIEKQEISLKAVRAANRSEIERLKMVADDTTKSYKDRVEAARKAFQIENETAQKSIELGKQKLANMLGSLELTEENIELIKRMEQGAISADEVIGKLGLSASKTADFKEFVAQYEEVKRAEQDAYTRNKEVQNKINSLAKETADKAVAAKKAEVSDIRALEDTLLKLVEDNAEKQREAVRLQYDRQIEDLQERLKTEQSLTTKAREAINGKIVALEKLKMQELDKLSSEQIKKQIDDKQQEVSALLVATKKGTDEEYNLKRYQLELQRDAELSSKELSESTRLAISEKYNVLTQQLEDERQAATAEREREALETRYKNAILQLQANGSSELELLQEQERQKLELFQSMTQQQGEDEEAFQSRKLEAQIEYNNAKKAVADKEVQIERTKTEALQSLLGSLSSAMQAAGEISQELGTAGKVLALAEIAVAQGVAIAQAVQTATRSSATWIDMLAAIATVVASVTAVMTSAIKTVKGAKFSGGGVVTGPGTGTSDSVTIQASNGEAVMTAAATSMFAPVLSTFNQIGGGVPIQVGNVANQTAGEDMIANAVAKGVAMMPAPVVSVKEITTTQNRVRVIEKVAKI